MYKSNTPTEYRQELRHKILAIASREFKAKGIRAVKMDDIAGILSISKRTMYEIYKNKEQLLMESVREDYKKFDAQMQLYLSSNERHVIDIILKFYQLQMRSLSGINPVYYTELHRYPEIITWIEKTHQQRRQNTQQFFKQGIEEGYFRPDANYEIISKVSDGTINYIIEQQLYKQYDLQDIFHNVIMLFLRGLCTLKGIGEFDSKIAGMNY
jgi:AcrR family transcriptional regulator